MISSLSQSKLKKNNLSQNLNTGKCTQTNSSISYKNAEIIRVQVRASTELYEKLQHLNDQNMIAFNSPEDRDVFLSTIMQVKRLAIFRFGSTKLQEQEAGE